MGKVKRKFAISFKQQVVEEIGSGLLTITEASRKYEISTGAINRWIDKSREGILVEKPTTEEKALRAENEKLKAKIGELTMHIDLLKKVEAYAQQRRRENTSVITGRNLAQFQGGAK